MNVTPHRQETLEPAGDRPPVAYDRAPTFAGLIAEKDVAVPMRDGINLSIDIYRPDAGGRFPALLAFSIYNKDLQGPDMAKALGPSFISTARSACRPRRLRHRAPRMNCRRTPLCRCRRRKPTRWRDCAT